MPEPRESHDLRSNEYTNITTFSNAEIDFIEVMQGCKGLIVQLKNEESYLFRITCAISFNSNSIQIG